MAVLQRRGYFNTEKMGPESYPRCCQVTCHGNVEPGDETFLDPDLVAMIRESREELGSVIAEELQKGNFLAEILTRVNSEEKQVTTFVTLIPADYLKKIRLGPDSGGLTYIGQETARWIMPVTKDMQILGPTSGIAMFPDEIEAVKKAFEVFGDR